MQSETLSAHDTTWVVLPVYPSCRGWSRTDGVSKGGRESGERCTKRMESCGLGCWPDKWDYVQNEWQLWSKYGSWKREALSWVCVMKGCVITFRFSVETYGVQGWRWSAPKTPQTVALQGCQMHLSGRAHSLHWTCLPSLHLRPPAPFSQCPAQLS